MQRIVQRSTQAQRQAKRRAERMMQQQERIETKKHKQMAKDGKYEIRANLNQARQARRENWELGPLAPKRDLGHNNYGVFQGQIRSNWIGMDNGVKPPTQLVEKRCAWAGGAKKLNLAAGDRVVILAGPSKGKIDRIREVDAQWGFVKLETQHQGLQLSPFDSSYRQVDLPISVADVRLVYPITDPKTGVTKDTIIHELRSTQPNMHSPNMTIERWNYGNKWDRLVPSLNMVIPWPEVKAPQTTTHARDTNVEDVESRTFLFSLLSPPMPEKVINELRNPYSRFRTRHEPWYIQQKEAEEALKKGKVVRMLESMKTPLQEFHEKQRALREAQPAPELTEEMLEKLGQLMAGRAEEMMQEAGIAEETTPIVEKQGTPQPNLPPS